MQIPIDFSQKAYGSTQSIGGLKAVSIGRNTNHHGIEKNHDARAAKFETD